MPCNSFPSASEDHGIAALQEEDLNVYSVGISTGGLAEVRMARQHPQRMITATTISQEGAEHSRRLIEAGGVAGQVSVEIEDLRQTLPHESDSFDFIYARLVLHYLSKTDLDSALKELYRILRPGGRIFVVVPSIACPILNTPNANYHPSTGLTTIRSERGIYSRYFHSEDSLRKHLEKAGFSHELMLSYDEVLCWDYERKCPSKTISSLIEILAAK